ncbi:MAG: QueT transporter family protein [Clostridia bacterium]
MKPLKKLTVFALARAAAVAALYFVLTFWLPPVFFGPIQFRPGEALTLLPLLFPESVIGLTVGCLLANIFSPYAWFDMVFGTLATLIAAVLTWVIGKKLREKNLWLRGAIGAMPPILVNAVVLPLMWFLAGAEQVLFFSFGSILATQSATILLLGIPLLLGVDKAAKHAKIHR